MIDFKMNTESKTINNITYVTYKAMIGRCHNKDYDNYPRYGLIGIRVCDRWLQSFENFVKDMGKRPSKEYTLDRIDPLGGYCKENCQWITKSEQSRKRRPCKNTYSKYKGVTWHKGKNKWVTQIQYKPGHFKWLGSFSIEVDAAKAYNKAAIKYYGEYCNLNKDENGNIL